MNKYFYYNYLTVSFANLLVLVPYVLIQNRYSGSVMAIGLGFIIGMFLLFLFTRVTQEHPNKSLLDIVSTTKQQWFIYTFVTLKAIISIGSSILVVGGYAIIVSRYLNPNSNLKLLLILVLIAVGYAATRSMMSIAYLIEFMMVVTIPFILFIMYKTFTNPIFNWDIVMAIGQHYTVIPNLLTLAGATFFFSGFSNLSLFILIKNKPLKFKFSWPAPIMALLVGLITIIVPIGILGSETAADYLFVWTVAADATEMPFGFIERLMFIFILVLLGISITYAVSTLSQILEVCTQIIQKIKKRRTKKLANRLQYYIYTVLAIVIFVCLTYSNDFLFEQFAKWYLIFHFIIEIAFTICLFIIVKWKGNNHDATST